MSQAKTLNERELKIVLATLAQGRHAARNRMLVLMSYGAGMRVGELAAIRIVDVLNFDGSVKEQVHLRPEQTKGNSGRVVLLNERLRKELRIYIGTLVRRNPELPLFPSQRRREGFTANSLCQLFSDIYGAAGITGASSHSGRRTFITTLANKGVSVRVLAALAGHKHISTTQCYIDLNEDMMKSAVNLL